MLRCELFVFNYVSCLKSTGHKHLHSVMFSVTDSLISTHSPPQACVAFSVTGHKQQRSGHCMLCQPLSNHINFAGKQERLHKTQQASLHNELTASCPAFSDSPSLRASHYMPRETMRPSSWHIHSDNFGIWPYHSSDYDLERKELAKEKRAAHAKQMSDNGFIVPHSILPIKGLCCFSHLEYDLGPYPVCYCSSAPHMLNLQICCAPCCSQQQEFGALQVAAAW